MNDKRIEHLWKREGLIEAFEQFWRDGTTFAWTKEELPDALPAPPPNRSNAVAPQKHRNECLHPQMTRPQPLNDGL